ncbi:MAG: single-stranded-DNA-specific exonuclease RecJ [Planctomycetes bacterium]|nr:single-stranded-DNA-specific exonuclease RecJ [Planctomycetota bacterium]
MRHEPASTTLGRVVESRWRIRDTEPRAWERLAREAPCSPLVARVLAARGIADPEEARRFLHPKLGHLHDPDGLPDMGRAVERIALALERREPIAIFGDYDVDGISSTCLLFDFFRFIGCRVKYRLPNRLLDGYGLRADAVRELAAEGVKLIITVDNGSSAGEEVDLARVLGVDVVITDHHQPPAVLPQAPAHVTPCVPASSYPFRSLAGVGVTFKLIWALAQRLSRATKVSEEMRRFLVESLALVALGTISDVVPLVGENRVLAKFGLMALSETARPGLRRLVESALEGRGEARVGGEARVDSGAVGYHLGPRINAAGRLGRAETAMDLLLASEDAQAQALARTLEGENRRRQAIERDIFESARDRVLRTVDLDRARAIVLESEGWHTGVIGIVAARIAQEFSRPTVLISLEGGRARGSARSVPGVHICDALAACSEYLSGFGGHEMAAGVELEPRLIESLRRALNDAISLEPSEMVPEVVVDSELRLRDLSLEAVKELELLEPHGHGNREPLLLVEGAAVAGRPRVLGGDGRHLAFHVRQDGPAFRAIAFQQAQWASRLERPGARASLLVTPRISRWQGRSEVELNVREIRVG